MSGGRWLRRRREGLSFVSSCRYNVGELQISSSIRTGVEGFRRRWHRIREVLVRVNRFDQFVTEIEGLDIDFVHQWSPHQDAFPLLITDGEPGGRRRRSNSRNALADRPNAPSADRLPLPHRALADGKLTASRCGLRPWRSARAS